MTLSSRISFLKVTLLMGMSGCHDKSYPGSVNRFAFIVSWEYGDISTFICQQEALTSSVYSRLIVCMYVICEKIIHASFRHKRPHQTKIFRLCLL